MIWQKTGGVYYQVGLLGTIRLPYNLTPAVYIICVKMIESSEALLANFIPKIPIVSGTKHQNQSLSHPHQRKSFTIKRR